MSFHSTEAFLDLKPQQDPTHWQLPIRGRHTGGRQSLFGGVGLAAGIAVAEQVTGLQTYWATAQYIATTQQPVDLDLHLSVPAQGRNTSQVQVEGRCQEAPIISIMAALGQRPELLARRWDAMPDGGRPGSGIPVRHHQDEQRLHDHVELTMARGMFGFTGDGTPSGDEHSLIWARMPGLHLDRPALAILADYMPSAVGNAMGEKLRCSSLDNTIRFAELDASDGRDWVLIDNRIDFVGNGIAHGHCLIWSEAGLLLASASQTMTVARM